MYDLLWHNNGDWDGLLRGGRPAGAVCIVLGADGNTVWLKSNDGLVAVGDAVQNGLRYYSVTSVSISGSEVNSFTLNIDSNYTPFIPNQEIVVRGPQDSTLPVTLATVLDQIGAYTYLVQYLFSSTVNMHSGTGAMPARFFYPTKFNTIPHYIQFIGQTLRAYWDFPYVVTDPDGEAHFIDQIVQISGVKMWQWVDKKLGKVLHVDENSRAIRTAPVMQMPCGAVVGRNEFAVARQITNSQTFILAKDIPDPTALYKGDVVRFYTSAPSMDKWDLPASLVYAECTVVDCFENRVNVQYRTGFFSVGDTIRDSAGFTYTITRVEPSNTWTTIYLAVAPATPFVNGAVLTKTTADVRVPGKHTMPLIQKATGIYLSYTYNPPIKLFVKESQLNWFVADVSGGVPFAGDCIVWQGTTYKINGIIGNNFYLDQIVTFGHDTELEICRSTITMACGITTPAYGEYFLSMNSTPLLYSNMTFTITGQDNDYNLIYAVSPNWSPYTVFHNPYCTKYIYKKGDYCYNGANFPRTMEHLTELLYEYQRLITIMWDQGQVLSSWLALNPDQYYADASNNLTNDPYWKLSYEGL